MAPASWAWPGSCDTPREGGHTSRFVDASLRRLEISTNPAFRAAYALQVQGRALPLAASDEPLAVRWREQRLFPCLHPGIPPEGPLALTLTAKGTHGLDPLPICRWQLAPAALAFTPLAPTPGAAPPAAAQTANPWQLWPDPQGVTVDLRQAQVGKGQG
jgi:hypothetical protein